MFERSRWLVVALWLGCAGVLLARRTHAQEPSSVPVPEQTQALIDRYRAKTPQPAAASPGDSCAGQGTESEQRALYLARVGGCQRARSAHATPDQAADSRPALSDDESSRLLREELDELRKGPLSQKLDRCLIEAVRLWPKMSGGHLVEHIELRANGQVSSVTTLNPGAREQAIGCCVERALKTARLHAPPRAMELEYPVDISAAYRADKQPATVSKEAIRKTIERHLGEVHDCYANALFTNPTLQGRINLRFVIDESGSVSSIVVLSSPLPNALNCCVVDRVSRWRFPKPSGRGLVPVTYPFDLERSPQR